MYLWVENYLNRVLRNSGGRPLKILITRDSAGDNLAAALTALAFKLRVKILHELALAYPALNLSAEHYTPNRLTCFDDPLIPISVLKLCQ